MIQSSNAELREKFSPKQRHQVAGIELRILNKFGFGFRVPNLPSAGVKATCLWASASGRIVAFVSVKRPFSQSLTG